MIELRTTSDEERNAMRRLAKRMNAHLEVCDEDEDNNVWYTLTEYAETDEEAAQLVEEIIGGKYEIV